MNKDSFIPIFHRSTSGSPGRIMPRILSACLVIGFACFSLFVGVSEAQGQGNNTPNTPKPTHTEKPKDTKTPKPTTQPDTPVVPTNTSVAPTDTPSGSTDTPVASIDTPLSSSTLKLTLTQTTTPDCTYDPTPTANTQTAIPTCTPTNTPTLSLGGVVSSTNTVIPFGKTSTPIPTLTLPQTAPADAPSNRDNIVAPLLSPSTPDGKDPDSGNPINHPGDDGSEAVSPSSGPASTAVRVPFLFWFTVLLSAGGAVAAFLLRNRNEARGPVLDGGGSAATMAIHPATVGAHGFSDWLAGQDPMLTQGEQVVLSKVRNGIGSALQWVGDVSDLKKISEIGTQEFLQLTAQSPFFTLSAKGTGLAAG
jgi:hypothetical protein